MDLVIERVNQGGESHFVRRSKEKMMVLMSFKEYVLWAISHQQRLNYRSILIISPAICVYSTYHKRDVLVGCRGCRFLDYDQLQLTMRSINQQQGQKDTPHTFIDHDLYILSYPESHNRLTRHPDFFPHHNPIAKDPLSNNSTKNASGRVVDRWRNIDRLVQKLKHGSKSKDKDDSACSRLYRLIHKMHTRFWKENSRQMKDAAFRKIKDKANSARPPIRLMNLKESLEMHENQIQKGSKNFQLNQLMHIVDLHQEQPKPQYEALRNSLSRNLMKEGRQRAVAVSPKKSASNVYILRRKTKEDLSTRQDLNSNTYISSQQCLPGPNMARSISPHSVDRSKSPHSVADRPINLPNAHQQQDSRLHQLEIDSVKLDKQQEIDLAECEGSNMRLPSFGMNKPSNGGARGNRLMNPQISNRKFIFHYRNSKEKGASPMGNEYFPPEVTAKFKVPISRPLPAGRKEKPVGQQVTTRLQRISSMHTILPRSSVQQKQAQGLDQNAVSKSREENSVQSRRCYSMPKITFTYKTREELANKPSPIVKNSPILSLNPLQSSKPDCMKVNNSTREDPYLCKSIQINNIPKQSIKTRPQIQSFPNKPAPSLANLPENYYNMPVNTYTHVNAPTPVSPRPQKLRVFSNYQTQPSTSFFSAQQIDYYGTKELIPTQDTLPSPNPNRHRIRSTDAYVLSKPIQHPVPSLPIIQKTGASADRERARSCGMKIEVVSRRQPLIRVA